MKLIKLQILLLLSLLSVYARAEKVCLLEAKKGVCLSSKVVQVRFTYDALGRRLSKTFKKTTTHFLWDANKVLHEWKTFESKDPITDNTITWIFNEYDYSPIAKLKNGKSFSILSDHLGTPTHMYNEEGEEVWSGTLDIYGRKRSESGAEAHQPFRYQGQIWDEEINLSYNRNRFFDPEVGNFISQDPIGLEGGNISFYGYVRDNNSWIDPFGLSPENAKFDSTTNRWRDPETGKFAKDPWSRKPRSIQDKMTLEAAKRGEGNVIIRNLGDPRFSGWEKVEVKVKSSNGLDSVVHYVRNPVTGEVADFKFKKHSDGTPCKQ